MKAYQTPLIPYDLQSTIEKLGPFPVHLKSIRDMDQALEEICKVYVPTNPAEENELLDLCPYFATVWPSARGLGQFMSERRKDFSKKRGIEVGCGLGLNSILAAKMGAQMLATDFHPDVEALFKENCALNEVKIAYTRWDWSRPAPPSAIELRSYDFVLASDVLYESRHPGDLVLRLCELIHENGIIYLSDPGRAYLKQAIQEFQERGFHPSTFVHEVEESSSLPEHRLEKKRKISVFTFERNP